MKLPRDGLARSGRAPGPRARPPPPSRRASTISLLPTAFETAENSTARGRRVSIVELMVAAKKEEEAGSSEGEPGAPVRRRGLGKRRSSLFDMFPDQGEEDTPKAKRKGKMPGKGPVKSSMSKMKVPKVPPPKMPAGGRGPAGGAGAMVSNIGSRLTFRVCPTHLITSRYYRSSIVCK